MNDEHLIRGMYNSPLITGDTVGIIVGLIVIFIYACILASNKEIKDEDKGPWPTQGDVEWEKKVKKYKKIQNGEFD